MRRRPLSLRRSLVAIAVVFVASSLVVSSALIVATTQLHRTSDDLAAATESVRLAQSAEIRLLLHMRSADPLVRIANEEELRERLASAWHHVTTPREKVALEEAAARVDAYLAIGGTDPEHQEAAFAALRRLVDVNIDEARASLDRAARVDLVANVLGVAIAAILIALTAWLAWWTRRNLFGPTLALATTMERFGHGERDVRAAEHGPREIREMQARFNAMAAALAEQQRTLMASLGGIAHDLRNPLTALQLQLATIDLSQPLPDEARVRAVLARVDRQITRIDRMITDLLDATKVEAGELELRPQVVDVCDLARSVADLFENASPDHTIVVRRPDEAVRIACDPVRIEQVLVNLVSNAIKYSPRGGEVALEVTASPGVVTIAVTDRGVGIPAAEQQAVFAAFFRGSGELRKIPGMGLGLYGARRIVELHGGHIDVESTPGRGSTFRVHLPTSLASDRPPDMSESAVDAPPAGAAVPPVRLRS